MEVNDVYDGWAVKAFVSAKPVLCASLFGYTRNDVIKNFEALFGKDSWKKKRRKGEYKLVKVRGTEVIEEV